MKTIAIAVILMTFSCAVEPQRTIETATRCTQEDQDNGNCPGNGGGGSAPSDPAQATAAAAVQAGYTLISPRHDACVDSGPGETTCSSRVWINVGLTGQYICTVTTITDTENHVSRIELSNCHVG